MESEESRGDNERNTAPFLFATSRLGGNLSLWWRGHRSSEGLKGWTKPSSSDMVGRC